MTETRGGGLTSPSQQKRRVCAKMGDTAYKLDILVPTHGHMELSIECIKTLYKNTLTPFHLIVMDDSTPDMDDGTDLTPTWMCRFKASHDNFTYIHRDTPYERGNDFVNDSLQYMKTPYLALVVNSITVEPEWEYAGLHIMESNPLVGAIAFKCLNREGVIESAGLMVTEDGSSLRDIGAGQQSHRLSKVYECSAVQWAFVLLRKAAIEGNLDASDYYGFKGWEDYDNCFTLRSKGWQMIYCGQGVGFHKTYATREDPSAEGCMKNLNNRERFAKKWGFWPKYHKIFPYLGELLPDVKARSFEETGVK